MAQVDTPGMFLYCDKQTKQKPTNTQILDISLSEILQHCFIEHYHNECNIKTGHTF